MGSVSSTPASKLRRVFVPVDKGFLKSSGTVEHTANGTKVIYRANYAAIVERGIPQDIPIKGTQVVHIKEYTRKDGAVVPAHDVKYVNKRLIYMRPRFRYPDQAVQLQTRELPWARRSKFTWDKPRFVVISKISKRPGQWFLLRATIAGLKELPRDVEFFLRRLERG